MLSSKRFLKSKRGSVWVDLSSIKDVSYSFDEIFMRTDTDADGNSLGYSLPCSSFEKRKLIKRINNLIEEYWKVGH